MSVKCSHWCDNPFQSLPQGGGGLLEEPDEVAAGFLMVLGHI